MRQPDHAKPGDLFRVVCAHPIGVGGCYQEGDILSFLEPTHANLFYATSPKSAVKCLVDWGEVESFVEKGFQSNFDEFYDFSYDFATLARVDLSAGLPLPTNKKGFMDMLKDIPSRLKRALNKNLKAMYQLDWIDEDLEVTEAGEEVLIDFILDKFEDELGEIAIKKVKEIEKEK
jgi:hypothetical protein